MITTSSAAAYAENAAVATHGDGETVALMLHGLGGDRHQPLGLLPDELDPRLTVVAPDQRAHGETAVIGSAEDFTLDALADDATALLASLGLQDLPLIVSGISMGAAVALRLAERGAHDIRGALLIRPAFETAPWPSHLLLFREIAALLRAEGESGLDVFIDSAAYQAVAAVSAAGAASLCEQFTKPHALDRVVRLESVPANPSIHWQGAWEPPCHVMIVGAAEDPVHPLTTADLWHRSIAGSSLLSLPSRDRHPERHRQESVAIVRDAFSAFLA